MFLLSPEFRNYCLTVNTRHNGRVNKTKVYQGSVVGIERLCSFSYLDIINVNNTETVKQCITQIRTLVMIYCNGPFSLWSDLLHACDETFSRTLLYYTMVILLYSKSHRSCVISVRKLVTLQYNVKYFFIVLENPKIQYLYVFISTKF